MFGRLVGDLWATCIVGRGADPYQPDVECASAGTGKPSKSLVKQGVGQERHCRKLHFLGMDLMVQRKASKTLVKQASARSCHKWTRAHQKVLSARATNGPARAKNTARSGQKWTRAHQKKLPARDRNGPARAENTARSRHKWTRARQKYCALAPEMDLAESYIPWEWILCSSERLQKRW